MPKLLAIDTSSESCSVALSIDDDIRERHEHAPMRHAELLLPAVQSLLEQAGLELSGLDAVAFGRGPGSFTSLRIGIGAVQGMAWAAGLPVVPVSSLAAVAQAAVTETAWAAGRICVAMDARMAEVYTGVFQVGPDGLAQADGEERVCPPEAVEAVTAEPFMTAGNGFERFECLQTLAMRAERSRPDTGPRAAAVCRLARAWCQENDPLPPAFAQPVYLRNQVAVKPTRG